MQCYGVSCNQGRLPCKTPGVCTQRRSTSRLIDLLESNVAQGMFNAWDFCVAYLQLRKTHPEQTRRQSLRIARKACWPNPSK